VVFFTGYYDEHTVAGDHSGNDIEPGNTSPRAQRGSGKYARTHTNLSVAVGVVSLLV
jgi:hypothetical protein